MPAEISNKNSKFRNRFLNYLFNDTKPLYIAGNTNGSPNSKKKQKEPAVPQVLNGVYMFPNGDKYDGDFSKRDDGTHERSGTGTHITPDGKKYQGQWTSDKMNGQGKMEFPSGAVYEGDFVNNQFHGRGQYRWPNGSYYQGQFNENRMEGDGQFMDTEGQVWTGTFRYKAAPGLRFKLAL